MRLRVLTSAGVERFRQYLASGADGDPPVDLLLRAHSSSSIPQTIDLEPGLCTRKIDFARDLCSKLGTLVDAPAETASAMWTTLALIYFDTICPIKDGTRTVRQESLYILSGDWRTHHRHLVATPCRVYRQHGEAARLLLSGSPSVLGDVMEQIASREELVSNPAVIGLLDRLYFDRHTGRTKAGATDREQPGSLRRLIDVLYQLDVTYDLFSLTTDQLAHLLPSSEFARWSL